MRKKITNGLQNTIVAAIVIGTIVFIVFLQLFLNEKIQIKAFETKHQITCNKSDYRCYVYKKTYKDQNYEYIDDFVMSNIDNLVCEKSKRFFDLTNLNAANSYYKIIISDPIKKFEIGQFKDLETCNIEKRKLLYKLNNVQGNENVIIYKSK